MRNCDSHKKVVDELYPFANVSMEAQFSQRNSYYLNTQSNNVRRYSNKSYNLNLIQKEGENEGRLVGFYTQKERITKIRKYKMKIHSWRLNNKNGFSFYTF